MEQGECMVSIELRRQSGRFATASFRLSAPATGVRLGVHILWHSRRALHLSLLDCLANIRKRPLSAGEGDSSRHANSRGRRRAHAGPAYELAEAQGAHPGQPSLGHLLVKRPVAAIALVPKSAVLFAAGAVAGALGKCSM